MGCELGALRREAVRSWLCDAGYILPELKIIDHTVRADVSAQAGTDRAGQIALFRMPENSATSIHREKKLTLDARFDLTAEIIASEPNEFWVTWVETDAEESAMLARDKKAVPVRGSHTAGVKEESLPHSAAVKSGIWSQSSRIAGYGLNWQHCARTAFPSASFSYEQFYQAIRRFWRYGQKRPVHAHCIGADTERAIRAVQQRKGIRSRLHESRNERRHAPGNQRQPWHRAVPRKSRREIAVMAGSLKCLDEAHGQNWSAYNGDTVEIMPSLPDASVGFSVFSLPFANLFVYSSSERDMGNTKNEAEFFEQYRLVRTRAFQAHQARPAYGGALL
jgi:hypothetical protein